MSNLLPLVTPQQIQALPSSVIYLDARGGPGAREQYNKGHLPGAIFVDLESELSQKAESAANGGRHPLPDLTTFAQLLTRLGITSSTHVVVYDDKNGAMAAARLWWMLKATGHAHVQVLDGGLHAWIRAGFHATSEVVVPVPASIPYYIEQWMLPTVSIDEVAAVSAKPDYRVIDVREAYRYRGEREPIDLIAGHIPGAVNVPYLENLNDDGTFRTAHELAEKYKAVLGGVQSQQVIVHCGSGVTACHTLLALSHAGIEGAKLYVGSWSEWSRNNRPVATGA